MIAAVVAVLALTGAFFGGMAASDPTASTEYKALDKKLDASEAELASTEEELSQAKVDLEQTINDLVDTEAQVDALVSKAQRTGSDQGEPAVSEGAAVAPRNFKLDVRTRSKECFGSAGCLLTVQIEPSYVGTQDVSSGSWELTYELRGGEDGPIIEQLTLEDGTFSFPAEQDVSTSSSSAVITAVVTEAYAAD